MYNLDTVGILITNATVAKLYSYAVQTKQWHLLNELEHPESKMKINELIAGQKGKYQKSFAGKEGVCEPTSNPKAIEAEKFALQLSQILEQQGGQFTYLIIFAPGHFQALIKKKLGSPIKAKIKYFIDKDYAKLEERKLKQYILDVIKPH